MRFRLTLLIAIALLPTGGAAQPPRGEAPLPAFERSRPFAGVIEGNWEYGRFRECGTPENCGNSFETCRYDVTLASQESWQRLVRDEIDNAYWIEFTGRKRAASMAERLDSLDPQICVVEVQQLLRACVSNSPIYPDDSGQRPLCAAPLAVS